MWKLPALWLVHSQHSINIFSSSIPLLQLTQYLFPAKKKKKSLWFLDVWISCPQIKPNTLQVMIRWLSLTSLEKKWLESKRQKQKERRRGRRRRRKKVFKEEDRNSFWQRKNVWEERILWESHSKKRLAGEKNIGVCQQVNEDAVSFVSFREMCSWEWVSFAKGAQSLQAYCPLPKPGSGRILQRGRGSRSPEGLLSGLT